MVNRWQLYSSMSGWGEAEEVLNKCLELTLVNMESKIHNGMTIPVAARQAFTEVNQIMVKPEISNFGADDTEPRQFLSGAIEKHIWLRYKVHCFVDCYGDVTV